ATVVIELRIAVDAPVAHDTLTLPFLVSGWAINRTDGAGPGVDLVDVWAYPGDGTAPRYLGMASYGIERDDVAAAMGFKYDASGFALAVRDLTPGDYQLAIFAHRTVEGS